MRDRMERFVILPFSLGCVSHASVAVVEHPPRRSGTKEEEDECLSGENMKHSSRLLALPKPNISTGVNRLVKSFKSLSQLFMYEDEMEELGMEMEIGCPTDVKHVGHIGWDGSSINDTASPTMAWDDLIAPALLSHLHPAGLSLEAASLAQFQLPAAAVAAVAEDVDTPSPTNATS
ncbi:hypothetical protein Nepgr_001773 [Nepenthes gracilis]|uniref:CRIB domain-containing protein n=1 Tax=Nepenthes gracilis TaxID=150966 RepID=A0AAD3P8R1_NEPGR|nr:hypothetical protein Nepgr_001773 [Nepenthes gracilis]